MKTFYWFRLIEFILSLIALIALVVLVNVTEIESNYFKNELEWLKKSSFNYGYFNWIVIEILENTLNDINIPFLISFVIHILIFNTFCFLITRRMIRKYRRYNYYDSSKISHEIAC
jgi:Na+/glutamate symporter